MPTYHLTRAGAIVDKDGSVLYEARDLAQYSQSQREALLRLHNENPGLRYNEGLEILRDWEREELE